MRFSQPYIGMPSCSDRLIGGDTYCALLYGPCCQTPKQTVLVAQAGKSAVDIQRKQVNSLSVLVSQARYWGSRHSRECLSALATQANKRSRYLGEWPFSLLNWISVPVTWGDNKRPRYSSEQEASRKSSTTWFHCMKICPDSNLFFGAFRAIARVRQNK